VTIHGDDSIIQVYAQQGIFIAGATTENAIMGTIEAGKDIHLVAVNIRMDDSVVQKQVVGSIRFPWSRL